MGSLDYHLHAKSYVTEILDTYFEKEKFMEDDWKKLDLCIFHFNGAKNEACDCAYAYSHMNDSKILSRYSKILSGCYQIDAEMLSNFVQILEDIKNGKEVPAEKIKEAKNFVFDDLDDLAVYNYGG